MQTKTSGLGLDLATPPLTVDDENVFGRLPPACDRIFDDWPAPSLECVPGACGPQSG